LRFEAVCVWWDYAASEGDGGWSNEGCTTVVVDSSSSYDCECTHLTHFSVLFQQKSEPGSPDSSTGDGSLESKSLEIVTFVGIGIGLVGVVATIIVLATACSLVELPQLILAAMLCTYALMLITFTAAIDKSEHGSDGSCTFVAYVHFWHCF